MPKITNPLTKLRHKSEKAMEGAIKKVATEIQRESEKQFKHAIDAFYSAYTPKMYKRTYNSYTAYMPASGKKGKPQRVSKRLYICGIYIDGSYSNKIDHYVSYSGEPVSKEFVFNELTYLGLHGNNILVDREDGRKKTIWSRKRQNSFFIYGNNLVSRPRAMMNKWMKTMHPWSKKKAIKEEMAAEYERLMGLD